MDQLEYKLLKHKYSDEDLEKIKSYNKLHLEKAKSLLKFNRDKLINDEEYSKLEISERIKFIQKNDEFKEFCKGYPIVSKYIIAFGLFSSKAFEKFLDWKSNIRPSDEYRAKLVNNPREQELWKNKYVYGIYVKYLYQEKNKHVNLSEINKAYLLSVEALNEETNNFFNMYEQEIKKNKESQEKYTEEKKEIIKKQLKIKLEQNMTN